MSFLSILFFAAMIFVALPILAYLVMKFGVAGYLRGKARGTEPKEETYESKRK